MQLRFFSVILAAVFLTSFTNAQVDDVSQVTGLPIPIGASVIYGQVMIRNVPRTERRPTTVVYLRNGGAQIDKYQTNDQGYWYFLKAPRDGTMLVFEIDGNEVGQSLITAGISNRFRQDVEFDWNALRGAAKTAVGVVSVRDRYQRSKESEAAFETALRVSAAGESDKALSLFTEIVKIDDKDFNAWVQIGTLHYASKRPDEARKAYAKALSLKPDYFRANLNLGKLELSQKDYGAAISSLSKAVEIDGESADANHLLGEAYLQNKKGSLAVVYLNKAIVLAPVEKAEIHLRLGALYTAAGYNDRASAEYKAFLEKVKDYPDRQRLEKFIKDNPPKT